ncbi:MAG TPA: hypothetical protein DCM05_15480 [Elusimicrobia bacterium]|nr:hypothetical protein [Elusimicrobiota bacterium]
MPGLLIDDHGSPRERELLDRALVRLQGSPTAKRLEARRRRLGPAVVAFAVLPGSAAVPGDKTFGHVSTAPEGMSVRIDESLKVSSHAFIETLAHELYGHALIFPESKKAGADIGLLMENEGFSLAAGHLIALELKAPTNPDVLIDALTESPRAYYAERLFTQSPDRLELSRSEAADPRGAVMARQGELARRRRSLAVRGRDMAVWKWQLDHLERFHGLDPRSVRDLRESVEVWKSTMIPSQRALLDKAEPHMKECLRWFDAEPEGREYTARMAAVSSHPYALGLEAEWAALGRRIAALSAAAPAEPPAPAKREAAPAVKQLDWPDVERLASIDRAKHPEHWTYAPEAETPIPWLLK